MEEDQTSNTPSQQNSTNGEQPQEEVKLSDKISEKYQKMGHRQMTYAQYMALKDKKAKAKQAAVPASVRWIAKIPILALFLFGLCFIPYMLYVIIVNPYVGYNTPKKAGSSIYKTSPAK